LLVFAGGKIMLSDIWKMPVPVTLAVIIGILAMSIGASWWKTRTTRTDEPPLALEGSAPSPVVGLPPAAG